jgi:sigma-B regulation protein RsbU (phosphoserine phosphatase)
MNILIAEDDPVSRRILEQTLVSWGYKVIVTGNGKEAWDVLMSDGAPSLAILDIMMPEMDGLEICQSVRRLRGPTPPYLILLTAMSGKDDVVNGIEAGANDYLTKPFHREELRVRVGVGMQMLALQRDLTNRVEELEDALARVKQLQGMLPICSYCKQVRDDQNYWHKVETYISSHADIKFSHGICPDCYERLALEVKENHRQKAALAAADTVKQ